MSRIEEVLKISLKPQGTTSAQYPKRPVFNQKEKTFALRLYVATKIKQKHYASCDVPVISLEELFLPSQSLVPMSLQKAGVCMFDHTDDGKCGLRLRHEYADMAYSQFVNILKNLNITEAPPYKDACRKLKGGEISQQARLKARKKHKKR